MMLLRNRTIILRFRVVNVVLPFVVLGLVEAAPLWDKFPTLQSKSGTATSPRDVLSTTENSGAFWFSTSYSKKPGFSSSRMSGDDLNVATTAGNSADHDQIPKLSEDFANLSKRLGFTNSGTARQPTASGSTGSYSRMDDGIDLGLLNNGNIDPETVVDMKNRLLASTKAVNVLTTVRDLQEEIKELNRKIMEENAKFQAKKKAMVHSTPRPTPVAGKKKTLYRPSDNKSPAAAANVGAAIKLLMREHQERKKLQRKGHIGHVQRAGPTRSSSNHVKGLQPVKPVKPTFPKLVEVLKQKTRQSKVTSAKDVHKMLANESNKRVVDKLEKMKKERQRKHQQRRQRIVNKQLSDLKTLKSVQQKKLSGLRQKNNKDSSPQKVLKQKLQDHHSPTSPPIQRLSNLERRTLLTWLDMERNSEVLARTDKKIADKLKSKKLVETAAKQVLANFESDGVDSVDSLTDDKLDDILLSIIGEEAGHDFKDTADEDYEYFDDFGVYYPVDESSQLLRPPAPYTRPKVQRISADFRPYDPFHPSSYRPPSYRPSALHPPFTPPTPDYQYQDYYEDYDADYQPFRKVVMKRPGRPAGQVGISAKFSKKPSHIRRLPVTLVSGVRQKVKSELSKDPPSSFINLGKLSHPQPPFSTPMLTEQSFSPESGNRKVPNKRKRPSGDKKEESLSFSSLMSSLLEKTKLPVKNATSRQTTKRKPLTSFRIPNRGKF